MKIIESFKEDINKSLKEIQGNAGKQVKELKNVIQNVKAEVETIKKTQMEANLEVEKSIIDRIQEIEERISGIEETIEEIDTTVKENSKYKKTPNPKASRKFRTKCKDQI